MKNYYPFIFVCLFLFSLTSNAQIFPYYFSVEENASYTPLSDSVSLNNGQLWDDPEFLIPLGFTFSFYDFESDTLYTTGPQTLIFLDPNEDTQPLLVPYGSDIIDRGYISDTSTVSESEVSYKIEGTPGNQIAKIEWKNVSFYNEMDEFGTTNNFLSYQLWLYEENGDVEVHFGPNNIKNDQLVHDGLGVWVGMVNSFDFVNEEFEELWYLAGDPQAPEIDTLFSIDDFDMFMGINNDPADGTIYRFSTSPPNAVVDTYVDQQVSVYPTLANDYVFVSVEDPAIQQKQITVLDGSGRQIIKQAMSDQLFKLDIKDLSKGFYFIHVLTEKGMTTKKIIKQ